MSESKPIDQASSAVLRGSWPALLRAAERARERAAQTGTALVVSRGGQLLHIQGQAAPLAQAGLPQAQPSAGLGHSPT